ncbi:hypothetical protein PF008_g20726 [Phytophthora fragariae]|uniref:Uncharacterized protein n=1 Tax=Phytophthora fragariae TaxID=53985 RepID=A0A6G0QYP6_9STRA|nr:hypothetical protein PF008_g20726 [Phytophthora fragariae]
MCAVPGGLTPYLLVGDIGIYKSFKDLLYAEINDWKESDQMEYTRFDDPRMPRVDTVFEAAGFARDPSDWFISKHDVYGARFRDKWAEESKDDENADLLNLSALDDALGDINLVDE